MQQPGLDNEQLLCRQLRAQVVGVFEFKVGGRWLQTFQQLGGNGLQASDQAIGVRRLLPE